MSRLRYPFTEISARCRLCGAVGLSASSEHALGGRLIDWRRSHALVCPEWPRWAARKGLRLDERGALLYPNETGPYEPRIRPKAVYANSLALLRHVKSLAPEMVTKSGLMVGLGETEDELVEVFGNMRAHNIDVLTVGQYLRPSKKHAEVVRYYRPEEFVRLKEHALAMGFGHVEAGPLVRSSYHADEQIPAARKSLLAG